MRIRKRNGRLHAARLKHGDFSGAGRDLNPFIVLPLSEEVRFLSSLGIEHGKHLFKAFDTGRIDFRGAFEVLKARGGRFEVITVLPEEQLDLGFEAAVLRLLRFAALLLKLGLLLGRLQRADLVGKARGKLLDIAVEGGEHHAAPDHFQSVTGVRDQERRRLSAHALHKREKRGHLRAFFIELLACFLHPARAS